MLSRAGSVLGSVAIATAIVGSALDRPVLMLFGLTMSFFLALVWLASVFAEVVVGSEGIAAYRQFGEAHQGSRVLLGRDASVTVRLINRIPIGLARVIVTDILPPGMRRVETKGTARLPPRGTFELTYATTARATGPAVFGGVQLVTTDPLGLVRHERLLPVVDRVHVMPLPAEYGSAVARGAAARHVGQHRLVQKGLGSSLHEIRPYLAGDSLRKIAWKAVARSGRLLTREVEAELNVPVTLLIDASPGMRAGRPGQTTLDHVIRVAAIVAATATRYGDPCGLGVFSDRGLAYIPPGVSRRHLVEILETLSAALTFAQDDPPEGVLVSHIYGYVHGVRPGRAALVPPWAPGGVYTVTADAYALSPEDRYRLDKDPGFRYSYLRRFCRDHGIVPPMEQLRDRRLTAPGRDRMFLGLMRKILLRAKERELFAIFSDFEGVEASPLLLDALRLARAHHHSVVLLTPFAPWFEMTGENTGNGRRTEAGLAEEVYALAFARERDVLRTAVRRLGIPVRDLAPEKMGSVVLEEVARLKRDRAAR